MRSKRDDSCHKTLGSPTANVIFAGFESLRQVFDNHFITSGCPLAPTHPHLKHCDVVWDFYKVKCIKHLIIK